MVFNSIIGNIINRLIGLDKSVCWDFYS